MGWNQTQGVVTVNDPGDVWTVHLWGLAYHVGILMYSHHNAEVACIYITSFSGVKNWVVIHIKNSKVNHDELAVFLEELTSSDLVVTLRV